jgi:hypothetical protein
VQGDSYAGSWDEGKFEGSGVFCDYSTGNTYDGAWVAGKREGQGKIVTLEGDEYTGERPHACSCRRMEGYT